jgi:hypothetical protein
MAYSDFTLRKVREELNIQIIEQSGIFESIAAILPSALLTEILEEHVSLALAINTEKARSELIIAMILVELRRMFDKKISFFSGIDFTVDKEKGLNGFCDYLISASAEQLMLDFPVVAIVEAKNENLIGGLEQCIAEMVAADIQNHQEHQPTAAIYGAVTSGNTWKFIKLQQGVAHIDMKEYYIDHVDKILGILMAMVRQEA